MAEAEQHQRIVKEQQRLMLHYAVDAREKEQRDLEAKRLEEERMRQARMMEEDRRVLEHR